MRRYFQLLTLISSILITGCTSGEPQVSPQELVKLGCADFISPKGLSYFTQAADLDERFRELAKSTSAIQTFISSTRGGVTTLDAVTLSVLKVQAYDDLATINSYCQ